VAVFRRPGNIDCSEWPEPTTKGRPPARHSARPPNGEANEVVEATLTLLPMVNSAKFSNNRLA